MKTLITTLGALLLLCAVPAQADGVPSDSYGIQFSRLELDLPDAGKTGLDEGRYVLRVSRSRLESGQTAKLSVQPAAGGDVIEVYSWSWGETHGPAATGCGPREGKEGWSFGPRSRAQVLPRPDGSRLVRIVSQEGTGCQFALLLPAVQSAREAARTPPRTSSSTAGPSSESGNPPGQAPNAPPRDPVSKGGGSPQPLQPGGTEPVRENPSRVPSQPDPSRPSSPQPTSPTPSTQGRPNVLTAGEKPPQCAPPEWQPEPGSPQPSVLGPRLTSSPADPPDAGCDYGGFLTPRQIRQVNDPALRSALQSLRNELGSVSRSQLPNRMVKQRISRKVNAVSRASRESSYSSVAAACEWGFNRCQNSCDSGCCCCTAHYAACVIEAN